MKSWQIFLLLIGSFATLGLIGIAVLSVVGFFEPAALTAAPPPAPPVEKEIPTSALIVLATGPGATSTVAPTAAFVTALPVDTFTPYPTNTGIPSLTPIQLGLPNPSQETISFDCIPDQSPQKGIVSNVIDGENIEVVLNGKAYPVHYVGIEAPETAPYKDLAAQMNRGLVLGQSVELYVDRTNKDPDGNLLRYVLAGKIFVNYQLVRRGVVQTKKTPPDISCSLLLEQAQTDAKNARLGIWKTPETPTLSTLSIQPASTNTP
jgi:endonuclease YncB( thermonuclease family)